MTDNIAATIKEKRERLHMTQKEFADALGLSKYGDRTIRRWERGETKPTGAELKAVIDFPDTPPYPNNENGRYRMIDLFAGIGGTRLGFHQTNAV
ncbi:helix-turn-helix domain-containing protein, partial [Escherichia coli]